ncbi:MAG: hypothetical protein HKN10_07065 [Myxococcales bacterium]|nr:hypothetical protein [Myxococcales bacterium]
MRTSFVPLAGVHLRKIELLDAHRSWLADWLEKEGARAGDGLCSASTCVVGAIVDQLLHGAQKWDWVGIANEYLEGRSGEPLAYSEAYGRQLHGFDKQWHQSPVYAIYYRWWIEKTNGRKAELGALAARIRNLIQRDGWVYNPEVSPTGPRTRMKSERVMSLAMSIEILRDSEELEAHANSFTSLIASLPLTPYLSSECFRLAALAGLEATSQIPAGLENVLQRNETGDGYCDFSQSSKVDDYMGSAKRTGHDTEVHSAIAAVHARYIAEHCTPEVQTRATQRIESFGEHIAEHPMDIPAFHIRDLVDIPFGEGVTPLELIAGSAVAGAHE